MLGRDWVIVLVLFGLISGVGYFIVEDMASSSNGYDVDNMSDASYSERYDTLTNTSQTIYQMQNATSSKEGLSIVSVFTTVFSSTFTIIGLIFGSFGMATTTMSNFAIDIGMPSALANFISNGILVIIIALIVFIVISSVSRGRL